MLAVRIVEQVPRHELPVRKAAILHSHAEANLVADRCDIAHGEIDTIGTGVVHLALRDLVRLLEPARFPPQPPARCQQICGVEERALCGKKIWRAALDTALDIGQRRQAKGFRISQLTGNIVAHLPYPDPLALVPVPVENGKSVVASLVPRHAALKALPAHREIEVKPERRGRVGIPLRGQAQRHCRIETA